MARRSEIQFEIDTDENNVPEKIRWQASDHADWSECRAMLLAVWDGTSRETLRIDLWNKEMQVDEMKMLVHQTILTLADSFERSTGEREMAMAMRDFCEYFAEKMALSGPAENQNS